MTDNADAAVAGERLSNAVLDNIYGRRSVRNFSDKEAPDEIIKEIIRAGTYTPTAMDKQPWRFVVKITVVPVVKSACAPAYQPSPGISLGTS